MRYSAFVTKDKKAQSASRRSARIAERDNAEEDEEEKDEEEDEEEDEEDEENSGDDNAVDEDMKNAIAEVLRAEEKSPDELQRIYEEVADWAISERIEACPHCVRCSKPPRASTLCPHCVHTVSPAFRPRRKVWPWKTAPRSQL